VPSHEHWPERRLLLIVKPPSQMSHCRVQQTRLVMEEYTKCLQRFCAGTASIEGARVGSGSATQRIAIDAGFITAQRGGGLGPGRRRLSSSDVSAAASKFLSPDGTVFYPGGTSWCARNDPVCAQELHGRGGHYAICQCQRTLASYATWKVQARSRCVSIRAGST